MNEREFREKLPTLLAHWSRIEASIKQAELLHGQVPIPAINELRYAGRQLIRAFSVASDPSKETELGKAYNNAEQYLINGDHDVTDAMVVYVSRRVSDLNIKFGRKYIEKRNPAYAELNQIVENCRGAIQKSRANLELRSSIYKALQQTEIPGLLRLFDELQNSDTMMNAELAIRDAETDRFKLKALWLKASVIILSFACSALAVVAFYAFYRR